MKLVLGIATVLLACSSAPKQDITTTPGSPPPAATDGDPAPAAQPATIVTTTASKPPAQPAGKQPSYSCFTYVAGNTTIKRHACTRSEDCVPYLEQAKALGGFRELSDCANVPAVHCFHVVMTKDEPDGQDVCQPTLHACKTARAEALKTKASVHTDCGPPS
jgi:hypothetical protein